MFFRTMFFRKWLNYTAVGQYSTWGKVSLFWLQFNIIIRKKKAEHSRRKKEKSQPERTGLCACVQSLAGEMLEKPAPLSCCALSSGWPLVLRLRSSSSNKIRKCSLSSQAVKWSVYSQLIACSSLRGSCKPLVLKASILIWAFNKKPAWTQVYNTR